MAKIIETEASGGNDNKKMHVPSRIALWCGGGLTIVWLSFVIYYISGNPNPLWNRSYIEIGTFSGGVFALAALWLIISVFIQVIELRHGIDELRKQSNAQRSQANAMLAGLRNSNEDRQLRRVQSQPDLVGGNLQYNAAGEATLKISDRNDVNYYKSMKVEAVENATGEYYINEETDIDIELLPIDIDNGTLVAKWRLTYTDSFEENRVIEIVYNHGAEEKWSFSDPLNPT